MLNDNDQIILATDPTTRKVQRYAKKELLGHGGFAKCYTMVNLRTGQKFAGKVIRKKQLKDKDARQKIIQQIQIHKSLNHPNICGFHDMFEFEQEIYIILELCQNNSLKEFLKNRVRITEFQAKCYLAQIVNGLENLHRQNILHRDIKLGNIFLNYKMEVKIGDFGLSTRLKNHRQRRFTTCGTPNYIAPEILSQTGHSFEVDIWAVGIILYALVIGRPPFQADTVDNTYKRIKESSFSFPKQIPLTLQCKSIIKSLLQPNPKYRIGLQQIRSHEFLSRTQIPQTMPPYTISIPPQSSYLKQYNYSEKHMKLSIFPRKISNTYDVDVEEGKTAYDTKLSKDKNAKKMARVLSLDKQLFKTTRVPSSGDEKSTLNRCHIYNSRNRINSILSSSRKNKLYGSYQNIKLSSSSSVRRFPQCMKKDEKDLCEVICYFDWQEKYGMGYLLSNGNYGVVFNDKTALTKLQGRDDSTNQNNDSQYIYYHKQETRLQILPQSLKKKQAILQLCFKKLQKYKDENIPVQFPSFTYAKKIVTYENFFMLKLTNDILQFFWETDTIVLRGQKWIKWRIGRQDGESRLGNPMLPEYVKEKVEQIRRFLTQTSERRNNHQETDFWKRK